MFLKITNRGNFNRNFLKLVGFTTKRDPESSTRKIGIFGSGIKAAAVVALRLQLNLIISSVDHIGPYILKCRSENTALGGGYNASIIRFLYKQPVELGMHDYEEDWNMTLDAYKDWDMPIGQDAAKAFKMLREIICNAYDEDPHFSMSLVGAEPEQIDFDPHGFTSVYIRYTPAVQYVLEKPNRYFKFLNGVESPWVTVEGIGSIYPKSEAHHTRLFVRGVLISCSGHQSVKSLFDYDLFAKKLISEDRTVKNIYDYKIELGKLLATLQDEELIELLLRSMLDTEASSMLENSAVSHVRNMSDSCRLLWLQALERICRTDKFCLASGKRIIDQDANQIFEYSVLNVGRGLRDFLHRMLGIPRADEVVEEVPAHKLISFSSFNEQSRKNFMLAFRAFSIGFPQRADIPIAFFIARDENYRKRIRAYAGLGKQSLKQIWIQATSETELRSPMDLLRSLIHESRHVASKAHDYNRRFIEAAEDDILNLLMRVLGHAEDLDGNAIAPAGVTDYRLEPNFVEPDYDSGLEELMKIEDKLKQRK